MASIHRPVDSCRYFLPASVLRGRSSPRRRFVIGFCVTPQSQIPLRSSPFPRATSASVVRGRGVHAALGCGYARPCGKLHGSIFLPRSYFLFQGKRVFISASLALSSSSRSQYFLRILIFIAQFVVSAFSLIS